MFEPKSHSAVVMRGAACVPRVSEIVVGALASPLQFGSTMPTPQNCFDTVDPTELARVSGGYSDAMFSAMQQAVKMGLTVNSTTTGGHVKNSMHYKGRAFDAYGSQHNMQAFYNWASKNTHPHELIHGRQFLKDGHRHAPIGGHNGHVHFSI